MKTILGLDIGSSALKIIALRPGETIFSRMRFPSPFDTEGLLQRVQEYLSATRLSAEDISRIALTGVGSSLVGDTFLGRPVTRVDEFKAIATGGLYLSGKERAIIVSMGTGTAFLYADKKSGEIRHLGGSGIGGGTLCGLCSKLLHTADFHEIEALAAEGRLSAVDLTVGDVSKTAIDTLNAELTAANFAKVSETATRADLAAGVVNMVLEGVGSMAVFLSSACGTKDVVLTGSLSELQQLEPTYAFFNRMYDINFSIPTYSLYACALGAALCAE